MITVCVVCISIYYTKVNSASKASVKPPDETIVQKKPDRYWFASLVISISLRDSRIPYFCIYLQIFFSVDLYNLENRAFQFYVY